MRLIRWFQKARPGSDPLGNVLLRVIAFPWREVPWGLILVVAVVLAIIGSGFWAAAEIWTRAHDGVYSG